MTMALKTSTGGAFRLKSPDGFGGLTGNYSPIRVDTNQ